MWRSTSLLGLVVFGGAAFGQLRVDFPADAPLAVASADWGESRISPRGGALVLDLRTALVLKNTSARTVRGVSLLVTAAELTAGGKASVTVPSLNVKPGETFPVRIDLRLLRPSAGFQAPVSVTLDGVLFDSLSFYGPNKLNSRRAMLAWELEARRDRRFYQEALQRGEEMLRKEVTATIARIDATPRLDIQVTRGRGRATAAEPGTTVEFAALNSAEGPVEILRATAEQAGAELRSPSFELRNRSTSSVRFVEVGWLARDARGGSFPIEIALPPGTSSTSEQAVTMRLGAPAVPLSAFVSAVEFGDGTVWVPGRRPSSVSPEEQRLTEIYRRKGLGALVTELRKFD
jgi:hypothetical protein